MNSGNPQFWQKPTYKFWLSEILEGKRILTIGNFQAIQRKNPLYSVSTNLKNRDSKSDFNTLSVRNILQNYMFLTYEKTGHIV
jgi:hypothetical protein